MRLISVLLQYRYISEHLFLHHNCPYASDYLLSVDHRLLPNRSAAFTQQMTHIRAITRITLQHETKS